MRTALKYAALMTLADSVWTLVDHRLQLPGLATLVVAIAVVLVGLALGVRERRNRDRDGWMTYEDAFLTGLYITAAYGVLDSAATYLYLVLARPAVAERSPTSMILFMNLLIIFVVGLLASAVLGGFLRRLPYFPPPSPVRASEGAGPGAPLRFRSREEYERWKEGQTRPAEAGAAEVAAAGGQPVRPPVPVIRPTAGPDRRGAAGRQRPYRALRILAKLYSIFAPIVLIGMVLIGLVGLMREAPVAEKVGSSVGLVLLGGIYYLLMKAVSDAIYILFDVAANTRRVREIVETQEPQPGA